LYSPLILIESNRRCSFYFNGIIVKNTGRRRPDVTSIPFIPDDWHSV